MNASSYYFFAWVTGEKFIVDPFGANPSLVKKLQQSEYTFLESILGRDEAKDEKTISRKIKEVAWMDQHGKAFQQCNSEVIIGSRHGDAENGVPAAFAIEARE